MSMLEANIRLVIEREPEQAERKSLTSTENLMRVMPP
jgi:hypothetical protein